MITTYSILSGLASVYYLWYHQILAYVCLFTLSYLFDCMDGQFARQYKMTTHFGDLYDHVTDNVVILLMVIVTVKRKQRPIPVPLLVGCIIMLALLSVSIGCQQRLKRSDIETETLDLAQGACRDTEWIHWSRYFGPTTCNIVFMTACAYLMHKKEK